MGWENLYVTDHGKPVLKIEPLADRQSIGGHQGLLSQGRLVRGCGGIV
jgi:antitoxin (DNA-binding transcriptional repressor) of toxin-antitoxin stability system